MWEQSRVEARRDERVWRGGAVGMVRGEQQWERWRTEVHVWMTTTHPSPVAKARLSRMVQCVHHECGFVNCHAFGMTQACPVCGVQTWGRLARSIGRWWKVEEACRCGAGCMDERVSWRLYRQMQRLPRIVQV